jgi:AcrR family transcriptional regulator
MNWRKDERRAERGYHHGNLKEALLQAALDLIGQKGAAGFTFADAARMAGVSPAAPYRHFRDRDELLSSIAQRGFEQFEAALGSAWEDGRPDTMTAFERLGKAYLSFAREAPAYYSAMFESGIPTDATPALQGASERAFGIIRAAAERLAALVPQGTPRPPALMMALHIWSMSHGIASLFARGDAAWRSLPMSPEDLLEAEMLIYLRGLGFAGTTTNGAQEKPPADEKPAGPWGKPK